MGVEVAEKQPALARGAAEGLHHLIYAHRALLHGRLELSHGAPRGARNFEQGVEPCTDHLIEVLPHQTPSCGHLPEGKGEGLQLFPRASRDVAHLLNDRHDSVASDPEGEHRLGCSSEPRELHRRRRAEGRKLLEHLAPSLP